MGVEFFCGGHLSKKECCSWRVWVSDDMDGVQKELESLVE